MTIDQVISVAPDRGMLLLIDGHEKVAWQLVVWLVSFSDKAQHSAWLHAWLDLDFLLNVDGLLSHAISLRDDAIEANQLSAAVEELEQGARPVDFEVSGVRVRPSSHSIFMQVAFDSLNHLDLLAGFVECDGVRVGRAKENLKHLERVTVESVA